MEKEPENLSTESNDQDKRLKEAEERFSLSSEAMTIVRKGNGFTWDERDELFYGGYFQTAEGEGKKRYMDSTGELTTLAIDQACRVVGQLPSGRFENSSGDPGKNLLMNLLFEQYVFPKSVWVGLPILQILRIANLDSNRYSVPVFVEWVRTDEYTGPKFVILNSRLSYPQPGKDSVGDMDYHHFDTFVSKEWLKTRNDKFFHNTKEIAEKATDTGPEAQELNAHDRMNKQSGIRIRHQVTKSGDWLAWNPDTRLVLIDEKKWFPRIPIAYKHQYPKIGSIWSFTSFERGYATQKRIDKLGAANERSTDMMIDPPVILDPAQVILSSFKRQPKAKWLVKDGNVDAVKFATVNPQALEAYSMNYQILKANLLSMAASTDTAVTSKTDPGFGKTPDAIKSQMQRMGSRDSWDQDSMQMFIEDLLSIAADEIAMKGVDSYSFSMLGQAIKRLKDEYPDENLDEFLAGNTFSIPVERVSGKYRYIMSPKSTLIGADDTAEMILDMLELYSKNGQIAKDLEENGERLDTGAAFKMILREKGSKFADKIITSVKTDPEAISGIGPDSNTVEPTVQPDPVQAPSDTPVLVPQESQDPQAVMQ